MGPKLTYGEKLKDPRWRKKRLAIVAAILLACSTAALSQLVPDEGETPIAFGDFLIMTQNGRTWRNITPESRIMFVNAIQDGLALGLRDLSNDLESAKILHVLERTTVKEFRFSDIAKQIDAFYSDTANVRIPIIDAYRYALEKMKGATSAKLDQLLVELRRTYNKP